MKLLVFLALFQPSGMVSKFLSWKEATVSNHTSIPNVPTAEQQVKIIRFGYECFDKIRVRVGSPVYVSSLYRSKALNTAVKGAKNSDHQILGTEVACDIDQDGRGKVGNRALFFILMHEFDFYKLIWEGTNPQKMVNGKQQSSKAFPSPKWIHISWSTDPVKNKKKHVYRMVQNGNRVTYLNFSTSGLN